MYTCQRRHWGLVCLRMHFIAQTQRILGIHVLDWWMAATKTRPVYTIHKDRMWLLLCVDDINGYICRSLTKNEPQRSDWDCWRRRRKRNCTLCCCINRHLFPRACGTVHTACCEKVMGFSCWVFLLLFVLGFFIHTIFIFVKSWKKPPSLHKPRCWEGGNYIAVFTFEDVPWKSRIWPV